MTYPHRAPDEAFAAAADARGVGELGGGWIFDRFGGYAWLYIGSFALGLDAVALALFFPPLLMSSRDR